MSLSQKQIILLISMNLIVCISLPISFYGIYTLYTHKHETYVIKRNYNIVILNLTFFIIFQIGEYILSNLFIIYESSFLRYGVGNSLVVCIILVLFTALLTSNWMRYYMNNWSIEISNKKWKHIITGNDINNWYINNKYKYGSWKYICKWVILFNIIVGIISCLLCHYIGVYLFEDDRNIIIGALLSLPLAAILCIPVIALIIIIRKTPVFDDVFFISKENRLHNSFLSAFMVISFGVSLHVLIPLLTKTSVVDAAADACMWSGFISGAVGGLYIVSSTFMVISDNAHNKNNYDSRMSIVTTSDTISDTLSNEDKTEAFIEHIIKELSIETIMCYIEFNQFISYIQDEYTANLEEYHTGLVLLYIYVYIYLYKCTCIIFIFYYRNIL